MMSSASAVRREHQRAASEFERSCADVSRHLAAIFDPWSPEDFRYLSPFGPRKPAKRAPRRARLIEMDVTGTRKRPKVA